MARPVGAKNKLTAQVKENIVAVFNRLGGTAGMAKWAEVHESEFYKIYASLAPKEINASVALSTVTDLSDDQLAAIATGSSEGTPVETEGAAESTELH